MFKMLKALTVAASVCLVLGMTAQADAHLCQGLSPYGYGNPGPAYYGYPCAPPQKQVKVYKVTKIIKYRKKKPAAVAPCAPACTPAPVCTTPCKPVCKPVCCKSVRKPLCARKCAPVATTCCQ